jgi:hypothetical protein
MRTGLLMWTEQGEYSPPLWNERCSKTWKGGGGGCGTLSLDYVDFDVSLARTGP